MRLGYGEGEGAREWPHAVPRTGWPGDARGTVGRRSLDLRDRDRSRGVERPRGVHLRGHAGTCLRRGQSAGCRGCGPGDRPSCHGATRRGGEVDGSRRDRGPPRTDVGAGAPRSGGSTGCGFQPGVPSRGSGAERRAVSRTDPGRGIHSAGLRRDAPVVPAVPRRRSATDRDGYHERRAREARLQRVPRAQDLLRQRTRSSL